MLLLDVHRLYIRESNTNSSGQGLDNIYTDSNDDGATVDGQSVHRGPSVKDKILACEFYCALHPRHTYIDALPPLQTVGSIGIFVIAFALYLYFYISPIVREKRRIAESKRLTSSSGTPLTEKIGLPSRCSSFSFTFVDKSEVARPTPERPRRILHRDSVGITKSKRIGSIFDLEPFLDSFPLPPSRDDSFQYERPSISSPPLPAYLANSPAPRYATLGVISEKGYTSEEPFLGLPSFPKLAPIVVLSDSLNDVSNGKILVSPNGDAEAKRSLPQDSYTGHVSLLATFPPKEPATILNPLNTPRIRGQAGHNGDPLTGARSAPAIRNAGVQRPPLIRQSTSQLEDRKAHGGPVYADVILPGYYRSQSQADALRLHSHKIRDSVFVRAANYAQKFVNPSSPSKETTELQFEMVKGDHDV